MIYLITIFLSAFLLFQVQFIMARHVLPWFGGSSSIWTTCLLFFQALLPLGYFYAHFLRTRTSVKVQGITHIFLIVASLYFLPITPDESLKPTDFERPIFQIIQLLFSTVGIPYFLLSATAPLIQHWFSMASPGKSPYRLYALSNAGSLLGLLSYPVFFERYLKINTQSTFWSYGFSVFAFFLVICVIQTIYKMIHSEPLQEEKRPIPSRKKFLWLGLPAIGTLMLLAVTAQMTQNIAAIPLFWAIPLSLYLISFIICFDKPKWYQRKLWVPSFLFLLLVVCFDLHFSGSSHLALQISLYSLLLFSICMICHGELYRFKPTAELLTSYYLHISIGGALGSLFVAVTAPFIFNDYWEFYIGLMAAYALVASIHCSKNKEKSIPNRIPVFYFYLVGGLALTSCIGLKLKNDYQNVLNSKRNFYGTLKIIDESYGQKLKIRKIRNGTISHGTQILIDSEKHIPTTYFGPRSGIGKTFQYLQTVTHAHHSLKVGVIGLGCGTLATYGRPGDSFIFYEINPQVIDVAHRYFTYLKDSKAQIENRLGDARILLEKERTKTPSPSFDLLILDAFTGDAPPIHLLTHEAIALYFDHLKSNGIVALHISNLYLDMIPIVRTIAKKLNKESFVIINSVSGKSQYIHNKSTWVLLTERKNLKLSPLFRAHHTREIPTEDEIHWTDDFSNIFSILK